MVELKELFEHKLQNFSPFEIDDNLKRNQKYVNIHGIDIYFPYEVYECQYKYMEKIISLLNDKISNNSMTNIAALESPTGTGKTLCLLCSTLSWMNEMRRQKKFGGKILYTTRTHSQITQIIHELNKTCYKPRTAILSSRDYSCVNDNVKNNVSGTTLNIKCRKISKKCRYYSGIKREDIREKTNLLDIEDICAKGRKLEFCPFYQQIEIAKSYSDIILMPYNYIFDQDINNIMEIDIRNNIVIIDEAHNIRKVCEDSKSVEIKANDFDEIILDLHNLINYDDKQLDLDIFDKNSKKKKKSPLTEIPKEDINTEISAIFKIQTRFNNPEINVGIRGKKLSHTEFFDIFITNEERKTHKRQKKKIKYKDNELSCDSDSYNISDSITASNIKDHITFLSKVNLSFQDFFEKGSKISILLKILNIISQLINDINLQKSYYFFMENEERKQFNKETDEINKVDIIRKFNIFCFNPKIEFCDILENNPFSIIFTSGTLTPFKLFEDELQIKFYSTLENEHIAPNDQFKFEIISNYSQNQEYIFDYNHRNNMDMIKSLGIEIFNYCKNTPYGGILVFFSSYMYLNQCNKVWNDTGINKKIEDYKKIYNDSSRNKNLVNAVKNEPNKNYIFYSVYRGSASEGIDFSDDCARVVICVGIPFADIKENKVKLKMEYMDNMNKEDKDFTEGREWYISDAMNAVNQSIGRVIRHINDYGIMVCIDARYKTYEKYLSFWIKKHHQIYKDNKNVEEFFKEQRNKFKDYIPKNVFSQPKTKSSKSGFNSVINNNIDINFQNEIKSQKLNTNKINQKLNDNMDIESSDESFDNNNSKNYNNKCIKKEESSLKYNCPKMNEENINIINLKEIGYKTNYKDLLNSIISKKPVNNDNNNIFSKWNVTTSNKLATNFDKEQKEGIELLKSINEFLNKNQKDFNAILNKYKI